MAKLQNPSKYCLKPAGKLNAAEKVRAVRDQQIFVENDARESGGRKHPSSSSSPLCASSPASRQQVPGSGCARARVPSPPPSGSGRRSVEGRCCDEDYSLLQQGRHFSSRPGLGAGALLSAAALRMQKHCEIFHCLTTAAWRGSSSGPGSKAANGRRINLKRVLPEIGGYFKLFVIISSSWRTNRFVENNFGEPR